jgi:hypothetical protein
VADTEVTPATSVLKLAEAELAAFLASLPFAPGSRDAVRSGDAWIDTMMALDWPERNHAGFFRFVSILTLACLTSHPASSGEQLPTTVLRAFHPLPDGTRPAPAQEPS